MKPTLVLFFLRLPFHLAVSDGAEFSMRRSLDGAEPPWVELVIHRVDVSLAEATLKPYEAGLARLVSGGEPLTPMTGGSPQTWVVAQVGHYFFDGENSDLARIPGGTKSIFFERAISAINRLLQAEMLLNGGSLARHLTKEALDPWVCWVEVADGVYGPPTKFRLHDRPYNPVPLPADPEAVTRAVRDAIVNRLRSDSAASPHPLVLARELARTAWASAHRGDLHAPTLLLQTSIEVLLRGTLRLLLVDEDKPESEIVRVAQDSSFSSVVKTLLPAKLGGDWSSPSSPVTTYLADLYAVRNELSHAGVAPPSTALNPALASHMGLIKFVESRVLAQWRRFPRTLATFHVPWAGGELALPTAAIATVEALSAEDPPCWLAHDLR